MRDFAEALYHFLWPFVLIGAIMLAVFLTGCSSKAEYVSKRTDDGRIVMKIDGQGSYRVKTDNYEAEVNRESKSFLGQMKEVLMLKWASD